MVSQTVDKTSAAVVVTGISAMVALSDSGLSLCRKHCKHEVFKVELGDASPIRMPAITKSFKWNGSGSISEPSD